MPIYEYQCQACKKHFEEMQKVSDEPLKICPNCGKASLEKIMSHTSFQLKGGGYYATDYKKSSAPEKETTQLTDSEKPKETEKKDSISKKEINTSKETPPTTTEKKSDKA